MKIEDIKTIVKLMSENDLTEFKIEAEAYQLCIKRGCPAAAAAPVMVQAAPVASAPVAVPLPAAAPAPAAPVAAPAPVTSLVTIDSPLVGTFYRAASPEATPFVKVGDKINCDTVIGIIEAMKVMNEIKAEKTGTVKDILVGNGEPVEYGQPLIVID